MIMKMRFVATAVAISIASCAFAEWVADESIGQAVEAWLASDRVAQMTMKGLSYDKLEHRGSLRVVRLSPTGYIVMSGSDILDPVISFSRNDFVEPEEDSPFYTMMAFSNEGVAKREADGGARTAKWVALIGGRDGIKPKKLRLLSSSPDEDASTILIKPFVTTHWNQWQPWNDFCPVCNPDEGGAYRGRCPSGCVATAAAQQIAYFKWPWRTGRQDTWDHVLDKGDGNAKTNCIVRFDGHMPFDWNEMTDSYTGFSNDSRGKIDESCRFPVARLFSWVDVITKMSFGKGGSSANFGSGASNVAAWYESTTSFNVTNEYDEASKAIKADLMAGAPVNITIPGHSIFAHGWASDGTDAYVYVNYGWGGSSDGWYKLYDPNGKSPIIGAFTGFRPKKMVQLEQLPVVSDKSFELRWHVPDFHKAAITGFDVRVAKYANTTSDETCDFSGTLGAASNPLKTYVTNNVENVDNDTDFLWFAPWMSGTYDLPGERKLTGSSILSYRVASSGVNADRVVEIQASFDGGEWQTVSLPLLNRKTNSAFWVEQKKFLGEYAGKLVRFRIKSNWGGGRVLFDDFRYADVLYPETSIAKHVDANARSCVLGAFTAGEEIGVSVTPIFSGEYGVESEWEHTRIAGTAQLPLPSQITKYTKKDLVYTKGNTAWNISGDAEGDTTIRADVFSGGFGIVLPGTVTKDTTLEFSWTVAGYYGTTECYDVISAMLADVDGKETMFWCVTNRETRIEKQLVRLSLAGLAGKSGNVILSYSHQGGNYSGDKNRMRYYAPKITNISAPVFPRGSWKTESFVTYSAPQIISVKGHDGTEIDEGFYRELVIGEDALRVRCSPSVTKLAAYPSHLTYLADEDVVVEKSGPNEFLVKMDTSKAPRRQRMILTLEASDANGTCAYRDVSMRFDEGNAIEHLDRWRKINSFSGKPVAAYTFDNSDTSNSGTGPFSLVGAGGNVTYEDSPLGRAIRHTMSDGPWVNADLDMSKEWTILAIAKTSVNENGVVFAVGTTMSDRNQNGFALVSRNTDMVKLSHWVTKSYRSEITIKVPGATEKYHAYAIRGNGKDVEVFVDGIKAGSMRLDALPDYGVQLFSVHSGLGYTKLTQGVGEAIDDWRMYYAALPDSAIAAYAATLMQFDKEPAGIAVEEGGTVVPECWFAKYCPGQTITRERLLARAANGRNLWECYVAGLDPNDADDDLVADITFENGVPKVSFAKGEKPSRTYRIYATKTLSGLETPVDVTDVQDLSVEPYRDYRFFRISAELP